MTSISSVFNGRFISKEKEVELKQLIDKLRKKGVTPKLVSILVGDDKASSLYLSLKQKAADRVGAKIEIISLSPSTSPRKIKELIKKYNKDKSVHGVMIQLPLPPNLKPKTNEIINAIIPEKDVDGMRDDSPFLTPVTKAVIVAIRQAKSIVRQPLKEKPYKVVVVGAKGFVGKKIVKALKEMGFEAEGIDGWGHGASLKQKTKKADILISATGQQGLITGDMVKPGVVVIDVGSPKGDVKFEEVEKKASFITSVPGGIGPVTISALLENLVEAAKAGLQN